MTSREMARPAVGPRVQTITSANVHELRALLRTEKAAGRIGPNHSEIVRVGRSHMWAVKVVRLADPAPRWKRRMWVGATGTSALAVVGAMVWHARYVLGTGVLIVLGIAALWLIFTRLNHSGACTGLHCSGCKC